MSAGYHARMNSWRPDLTTLRLFVAVCDEASISKAAERESIAPSAVSKRIAEVESSTGVVLLVRGGRGVKPTTAGHAFLEHARRIVDNAALLEAELDDYGQGAKGHVRLCANISSLVEMLPKDVGAFMRAHPQVRVDIQERVSSAVAQGVRDGDADIGVCLSNVDLWGLRQFPYGRDELMLVLHRDHPLARESRPSFEQVMEHELVGLQTTSQMTTFLAGLAARKGHKLRYRSYVSTYEAVCHLIAENLGVAILSSRAVQISAKALDLLLLPLAEPWASRSTVVCVNEDKPLSEVAGKLLAHLRSKGESRLS